MLHRLREPTLRMNLVNQGGVPGGITNLEIYTTWLDAPASGGQILGALQFGTLSRGNIGLTLDGAARGAIFSMWDRPSRPNSTTWDAASYPNCSSFNVDGTGVKCSLTDYNWVTNRQYLLRVEVDWTGTVWTGKIKDMFTGNETVIGVMQLATEDYFGANHIAYVEYPAANSCSGNPSSQVLWEGPYANNGTAVARYAYADYRTDLDSPVCMNQNVTTTVTGKPTAIHTIADNAQTTTLPSREIWNPPVVATLPLTPATAGCATFNATINT